MPPLRLEIVTQPERLLSLRPHWGDLWERCPQDPFQSPEWLLPWWQLLGGGRLRTLALWQDTQLVGLAPLFVAQYFRSPLRRLALLGTGNTDYLDVLLDPSVAGAAGSQILDHLATEAGSWDFCDFQQLRAGSPLLAAAVPASLRQLRLAQEVCPVLPLPGGANSLDEVWSGRLRSNLRYYRKKLLASGGILSVATREELELSMEALYRLHAARWNRRKLPGVFTSPRVRQFHLEVARGFQQRGWLRLHTLVTGTEVRAALYCFACRDRHYYYAGGFDPELARFSPGTVLTGQAIQTASQEGAREFDFLRGDEPYKYTWGATNQPNYRRLIWNGGGLGALAPVMVAQEIRIERFVKNLARRLQERSR